MSGVIIVPMRTEPDHCPSCGNVENIKRVCHNCGHEYKDAGGAVWPLVAAIVVAAVAMLWLTFIVLDWLSGPSSWTLRDHLVNHFRWLASRRVW